MEMLVAFAPPQQGKIDRNDVDAFREFNGSFVNEKVSSKQFLQNILERKPFTAPHHSYRKSKNFISCQHVGLDFDAGDYKSSFEFLKTIPVIRDYANFLATSPSNTLDVPKSRVVFRLDREIINRDKYILLVESFLHHLKISDQQCKDACRFFYGVGDVADSEFLGSTISLTTCRDLLVIPYKKHLEQVMKEQERILSQIPIVNRHEINPRILAAKKKQLLKNITQAPDKQKHDTLRANVITLAGYMAAGYFSYQEVLDSCVEAIRANPNNVKDMRLAETNIKVFIGYGRARPIYFRKPENENGKRTFDVVGEMQQFEGVDATDPKVVAHVQSLVDQSAWLAYNQALEDYHYQMWFAVGVAKEIVDEFSFGFRKQIVDPDTGEIFVTNALTVPYKDDGGKIVNLEYRRLTGEVDYEIPDLPSILWMDREDKAGVEETVIFLDTIDAINFRSHYGDRYRIGCLTDINNALNLLNGEDVVLMLNPGQMDSEADLGYRTCRLPVDVQQIIGYEADAYTVDNMIYHAK